MHLLAHSTAGASLTPRLYVCAQSSETRRLQPRYSVVTGPAIFSNPKARDGFIVPDGVLRRRRPVLTVGIGTLAVSTDCERAVYTLPAAAPSAPEQCSCGIPYSSAHCIRRRPVLAASQPARLSTVNSVPPGVTHLPAGKPRAFLTASTESGRSWIWPLSFRLTPRRSLYPATLISALAIMSVASTFSMAMSGRLSGQSASPSASPQSVSPRSSTRSILPIVMMPNLMPPSSTVSSDVVADSSAVVAAAVSGQSLPIPFLQSAFFFSSCAISTAFFLASSFTLVLIASTAVSLSPDAKAAASSAISRHGVSKNWHLAELGSSTDSVMSAVLGMSGSSGTAPAPGTSARLIETESLP